MDEMTFTLNNPLTEEEWDLIEDVDFDNTNSIEFHTKHGKTVKFVKCTDERAQDLISRQAAIAEFSCCELTPDGGIDANYAIDFLKQLPSAQTEPQWIPCRKHLPSLRDEIYLVSLAWGSVGTMELKDTGWHNYGSLSPVPIETVTAWMPLPEPYKERREE